MAFFLRTTSIPPLPDDGGPADRRRRSHRTDGHSRDQAPARPAWSASSPPAPSRPTEVTSDQFYKRSTPRTARSTRTSPRTRPRRIQNGKQKNYEGNGALQLLSKTFQRLILARVDHEAVTTDGGTTKGQLSLTVTVNLNDQDGSSNTNKDMVIPAGYRFGSSATFAGSTRVFATSGNTTIPKGTALTTNTVTVLSTASRSWSSSRWSPRPSRRSPSCSTRRSRTRTRHDDHRSHQRDGSLAERHRHHAGDAPRQSVPGGHQPDELAELAR
jgi:hypothetical protein